MAAAPERSTLPGKPTFLMLWIAGALGNATRWFELLVSGVVTFDLTGSALAVAIVTMMRTLPNLVVGAIAGGIADSMDRKQLLLAGQALQLASAATIALLAWSGQLAVWHLACASLVGGMLLAADMSVRRRMMVDSAGETHVARAVALDTMTMHFTRMAGPALGGVVLEFIGVTGAFAAAAVVYALTFLLLFAIAHVQSVRRLSLARLPRDIADAAAIVRRHPELVLVLMTTVAMNVFGFCYAAAVPAWGRQSFAASASAIGMLAAAEPLGAFIGGFLIASGRVTIAPPLLFAGGTLLALCGFALAAFSPFLALAWLVLLATGLGVSCFSAMQTTLVMLNAPIAARSRVLGLVTTCIGLAPTGVLAVGWLSDRIGPARAISVMALTGVVMLVIATRIVARMRGARANRAV
jgi:MFS family permease